MAIGQLNRFVHILFKSGFFNIFTFSRFFWSSVYIYIKYSISVGYSEFVCKFETIYGTSEYPINTCPVAIVFLIKFFNSCIVYMHDHPCIHL